MQNKRRTTTEALTDEQRTFLQDGSLTRGSSTLEPHAPETYRKKMEVISTKAPDPPGNSPTVATHPDTRRTASSNRQGRTATQSVTFRLREPIARNLRKASIERSLVYRHPYTQQAITEAALTAWLQRNGYPIDE